VSQAVTGFEARAIFLLFALDEHGGKGCVDRFWKIGGVGIDNVTHEDRHARALYP
jgi:hypothetical protein